MTGYVIPLALIGPIAQFIGVALAGFLRASISFGISAAIAAFILAIVGVFVLAWIINALAPTFGATQSMPQAIKLAAYSMTAAWISGIFYLIPWLGALAIIGVIYTLYLFFIGLPILMKSPADKTVPYAVSVIVACIVVLYVISQITYRIAYM